MAKTQEPKVELEREYIIPLRKEWLKVPKYKRANKAVKAIRQFIVRHMKVYDRDLKKVKLDRWLNHELWFRGIKKPPAKIKIKAIKQDNGIIKVELAEIPQILKYKIAREEKAEKEAEKVKKEKKKAEEAKAAAEKQKLEEKVEGKEEAEEKKEKEEKKEAVVEAGLKQQKKQARQQKHVAGKTKQPKVKRMALQK